MEVPSKTLQRGLNFADALPELFDGKAIGEDAFRVLTECIKQYARIRANIEAELPQVCATLYWAARR